MIMADVFKILFLILGMVACTISYWLLFGSLFPRIVARTQQATVTNPYRVFMTGALVGAPLTLISFGLAAQGAGPLKLLGIFFAMSITLIALFGSTGLIRQVGVGLANGAEPAHNGALILRGGSVVSVACVFPVVGWFMVIPVILVTGFGAALRVWLSRQPSVATQSQAAGVAGV